MDKYLTLQKLGGSVSQDNTGGQKPKKYKKVRMIWIKNIWESYYAMGIKLIKNEIISQKL